MRHHRPQARERQQRSRLLPTPPPLHVSHADPRTHRTGTGEGALRKGTMPRCPGRPDKLCSVCARPRRARLSRDLHDAAPKAGKKLLLCSYFGSQYERGVMGVRGGHEGWQLHAWTSPLVPCHTACHHRKPTALACSVCTAGDSRRTEFFKAIQRTHAGASHSRILDRLASKNRHRLRTSHAAPHERTSRTPLRGT